MILDGPKVEGWAETERWVAALDAMVNGDTAPLGALLHASPSIPEWVRMRLAKMLNPGIDLWETIDPDSIGKLVFHRPQRIQRKAKNHTAYLTIALAVSDAQVAGEQRKNVVTDIAKRLRKSPRYVEGCIRRMNEVFPDGGFPEPYKVRHSTLYRTARGLPQSEA